MKSMKLANYLKWRDDFKTGDLLLYKSNSTLGWLIRLFSRANVNHAGLVIRLAEYGDLKDRRFTLEALEGGVVLRILSRRFEKFNGQIWWYPLKNEFDYSRMSIGAWALLHVGIKYDYKSLFKLAVSRVSSDARKFFCSEYCYMAYEQCGVVDRTEHAPRPGGLPNLGVFKEPIQIL